MIIPHFIRENFLELSQRYLTLLDDKNHLLFIDATPSALINSTPHGLNFPSGVSQSAHRVAVQHTSPSSVAGLFGIFLPVVLRYTGEQVLNEHGIRIFTEFDAG